MPSPLASPEVGVGADAARRLIAELAAKPRPAGSAEEAQARTHCAVWLRAHGFMVREEPFEFSALPGRYATAAAGALSIGTLAAAGHVGFRGAAAAALGLLLVGTAVLVGGGLWLARVGVLGLRWMRRRSVNLVAQRGVPAVWLVAHLDSKSQPVPILVRAAGITASAAVWLVALATAALQFNGLPLAGWWPWISAAGLVAGLPVAASLVGSHSPGAADNASGVAAVLLAARAAPADQAIGVVLTSGEELGLAGARAWARGRPAGVAINCDTLDDDGELVCMVSGSASAALAGTVERAAARTGASARVRRLLPGILTDGVALADAGWQCVTLSRGTVRTLSRLHRPLDRPSALKGAGARLGAAVITEALEELA